MSAPMPAPRGDLDVIELTGVRAWGHHGVLDQEKQIGQEFVVDVALGLSTAAAGHSDALSRTVNYAEVAALVNSSFVPVKVDREERPDVDAVYMRATQALTGHGGWPMTVFLTPEGEPFFAGTYYPPQPAHGMPSFTQLVTALGEAWRDRRDEVAASASAIVAQLAAINALPSASEPPGVWELLDAVGADFDLLHGGFGGAPKFPMPLLVDALLVKGETGMLDVAHRTLEAMARGGIHDQVGGGFHRYAVDAGWVVPHFEKMPLPVLQP